MLPIIMVTEGVPLPWKIDGFRGGAGVEKWGFGCLHRGGGGFPWASGQRMFTYGGKRLAVLINIKSFLVCQGIVGGVVCDFTTCCMLDTSLSTW